jgi:hypothetical protein
MQTCRARRQAHRDNTGSVGTAIGLTQLAEHLQGIHLLRSCTLVSLCSATQTLLRSCMFDADATELTATQRSANSTRPAPTVGSGAMAMFCITSMSTSNCLLSKRAPMLGTCSRNSCAALPAGAAACKPPLLPPAPAAEPPDCCARWPCCWCCCRFAALPAAEGGPLAPDALAAVAAALRAVSVALCCACLVVTSWHCSKARDTSSSNDISSRNKSLHESLTFNE